MNKAIYLGLAALLAVGAPGLTDAQGKGQGQGGGKGASQGGGKGPEKAKGPKVDRGGGGASSSHVQAEPKGRGKNREARVESRGPGKSVAKGSARSQEVRAANANGDRVGDLNGDARGAGKSRGKFMRAVTVSDLPSHVRRFAASSRQAELLAAGALARAHARGRGADLELTPAGDVLRIRNKKGEALLVLDEERARNLGRWSVDPLNGQVKNGSPSFCRSGAGHPVWGKQWCLDKGFGLGDYNDYRWGRTNDVNDIVWNERHWSDAPLVGDGLLGALGPVAYNRLALHAITLGLVDPLVGRWVPQPDGPRVLMVNSGVVPVAEVVDYDRDWRADLLLVALRNWLM